MLRHFLAVEGFSTELIAELNGQNIVTAGLKPGSTIALVDGKTINPTQFANYHRDMSNIPMVLLSGDDTCLFQESSYAFDFVLKGLFEPRVLLRILKKYCVTPMLDKGEGIKTVLTYCDLLLNRSQFRVFRNGQKINITPLQFKLLEKLMQKPEIVWSRQELIDAVWGAGADVEPRTVDIHIGHIRRALASVGPNLIRTVHSRGYALDQLPER